jgi:hypothetical protein
MDIAFRLASGAVGVEFPRAKPVQNRLGHDRTRRITGAEKQHVVGKISHIVPPSAAG